MEMMFFLNKGHMKYNLDLRFFFTVYCFCSTRDRTQQGLTYKACALPQNYIPGLDVSF